MSQSVPSHLGNQKSTSKSKMSRTSKSKIERDDHEAEDEAVSNDVFNLLEVLLGSMRQVTKAKLSTITSRTN